MLLTCDINKRKIQATLLDIDPTWSYPVEHSKLVVRAIFEIVLRCEKNVAVKALIQSLLIELPGYDERNLITCVVACISLLDIEIKKIRGIYYLCLRQDITSKPDLTRSYNDLMTGLFEQSSDTARKSLEMNFRYLCSVIKLLNVIEKVHLITSTGKILTKSEVINQYKLSEREYKRFNKLYTHVSTSFVLKRTGMNIISIPKAKAIIRHDLRQFSLSDQNLQKIRIYSQIFKESDEHTLNRVVREFFFVQEKTKRLRKKRG
ncbi:hypothetical protein SJI19_16565 [Acerihabitans sp. TG2]|uniref:hypothetical protein n=1 Tax=Acerihabitans sp. TG2 TaxID=3096008 RepID=UPI002B23A64C|nr:hypothetical protein [Acerihabitans sp. TG2]MEA9392138.1 hypothetical protein [Acerihabitans sp. TG2]